MRALIPTHAVEGAKVWKAHLDSVCSEVLAFTATNVLVNETGECASTAFLPVAFEPK
jgi:hypothetical protein